MGKFILVMVFHGQLHAYGTFTSEEVCLKMAALATVQATFAHSDLINICYREALFKELFPKLPIEEPST